MVLVILCMNRNDEHGKPSDAAMLKNISVLFQSRAVTVEEQRKLFISGVFRQVWLGAGDLAFLGFDQFQFYRRRGFGQSLKNGSALS